VGKQQKALFVKIISELLKLAFDGEQAEKEIGNLLSETARWPEENRSGTRFPTELFVFTTKYRFTIDSLILISQISNQPQHEGFIAHSLRSSDPIA
jgi:hypothetical protein